MLKTFFSLLVCLAAFSLVCFALFLFYSENRKLFSIASLNRETNPEESAGPTGRPGKSLDPCADVPPNLQGVLQVEFRTNRTLQDVRNHVGPFLQQGGRYRPTSCRAKQKVAVIIPFRNRYEHLTHWLYYLHPVLMRQQLDYDLVPIDDRNLYRCSDHPRHLSVAVDKFNFILPYATIFGGVSALSEQQFLKVNGFSNTFWGWGGEDDDMSQRISYRRMFISRPDSVTGRYKMIKHKRDSHNDPNPRRIQKLRETYSNMDKDGLNSLNYTVREIRKDLLYTFVTVDVQADVDPDVSVSEFNQSKSQFKTSRTKNVSNLVSPAIHNSKAL
ncbi:beta-1,4-galactosyltransferase 2-like isoform X3 [Xiphophorus maculatus]|uniref:beta-1,4-galactosyltransferase 2-like isoform X3 n=1 Tax=Xiphophorus maculatus TaxID=8083 RepID=UPI000C6DD410|nr:beta-1,4-galactosyltransferase 2-like isoform X3 [Xiphophorus maculatus]